MTADVAAEVSRIALQQRDLSIEDIELILEQEWEPGLPGSPATTRGPMGDFLRDVAGDLLKTAREQTENVSVLTGVTAAQVVAWAEAHGIDAARYEYPLALLAAWVTASVLRDRGALDRVSEPPSEEQPGDPNGADGPQISETPP